MFIASHFITSRVACLVKEPLPRHFTNPLMRVQKLENLQMCFKFLEQHGLSLSWVHAEGGYLFDGHMLIANTCTHTQHTHNTHTTHTHTCTHAHITHTHTHIHTQTHTQAHTDKHRHKHIHINIDRQAQTRTHTRTLYTCCTVMIQHDNVACPTYTFCICLFVYCVVFANVVIAVVIGCTDYCQITALSRLD